MPALNTGCSAGAAGGVEYPLTHNIAMLLARVAEAQQAAPPDAEALPRLTPFGVGFRYGEMDDPGEVQLDFVYSDQ